MKALLYYIALPFIYFISILPLWCLYRYSNFLFIMLYYIVGYRKKVVMNNLQNSFPEKNEEQLKSIAIKFYRYFCDLIVETLKSLTISPSTLRERLSFTNLKVFEKYYTQKQSIIIVMGHWGNWELAGARLAIEPLHKLYVIYHPLHNKYFNRLVCHMRTRLGNGLYTMQETLRRMLRDKADITVTAFIADQTPSSKGVHWMEFLNQDTPVFAGIGRIAKKMNYPVVYVSVKRTKRGYYEISLDDLVPAPAEMEETDIVERFTKRLEQDIRKIPEIWLWTHKRWKHKRKFV